jgi:RimJ/RimL family protein N-acetyltransferase
VLQTRYGACLVDRWPGPRAALVESAGNYVLVGDPDTLAPDELRPRLVGVVDAGEHFQPLLRAAFPTMTMWERVILELAATPAVVVAANATVHRLSPSDAYQVWGLSPEVAWISGTWGGPAALAASDAAWGALVDGRLVAVACSFFFGEHYEDIGVITEREYRGQGLSTACAAALCADIQARGRRPSWSTSPDNAASRRVAEKLGFRVNRHDRLTVVGRAVPKP